MTPPAGADQPIVEVAVGFIGGYVDRSRIRNCQFMKFDFGESRG